MPRIASPVSIDTLESRRLMSVAPPNITNVIADNRGEVIITTSRAVTNVNKNSVRFFTAGADGAIGNADDIRKTDITVKVSGSKITVRGNTDSNAAYRVRLEGDMIADAANGKLLDGEFSGTFPTGNGKSEGDFNFMAKRDRSATPTLRMTTTEGVITLRLRKDVAPATANNFLSYVNSGRYDFTFYTRSENNPAPFVIQGGSLQITGSGTSASDVIATARDAAVADENDRPDALSNTIGTLSFAKSGPDDATNQFFINLADNSFLDSPSRQDGGFTPFAEVTSGLSVAQAINQLQTADLSSQIGTVASSTNTGVSNAPVLDPAAATALNPLAHLPYIRRIAGRMKLSALP